MGIMPQIFGRVFGGGARDLTLAVGDVADGFRRNATREMELKQEAYRAALSQHGTEFAYGGGSLFDRIVNGLNRLPRPMLALGTIGLFVYAMVDPAGFAPRMAGLAAVPDPLWWLLGAIVSFYFGARELHYARRPKPAPKPDKTDPDPVSEPSGKNAALDAWRAARRQ